MENSNFPNRRTIRLPEFDYAQAGYYFVTINCHKKQNLFGEIQGGQIELNQRGQIAKQQWLQLPFHFSYVLLDAFIVMPNHIHGILAITENSEISPESLVRATHASQNSK